MKSAACICLCTLFLCAAEGPKETFDRAVRALSAAEYDAAERLFQSVLRQEPRNIAALSNLGVLYSRTSRADQAIAMYRRALQVSPDDKPVLLNLGLVYLRREDHTRALPLFARVVALEPANVQARQLAAVCRVYLGDLEPAIRDLEQLRAAAPRDEDVLFLLGFAYLKSHDSERAKGVFEQMFQTLGSVRAQFLLGRASYEATLFPQAEESFLEVLRLDPKFPGARLELGKVYISLRRPDDATREFQTALKENPADADAGYFLGAVLVQADRYAEGISYLERATKAKPDFWAPFFYLGKAKLRSNQPAAAVSLLERAVKLNSDDATAAYLLGQALEDCGRNEEARRAFQRVRELQAAAAVSPVDDRRVAGAR